VIRDRRDADLEPLCAILKALGQPAGDLSDVVLPEWLLEHHAAVSWVYDMAPVHVAPTRNVVGHVQVTAPPEALGRLVTERTGRASDELLAVTKLFVRPDKHQHGFARHLLKEAVAHVRRQGKAPVLDLQANPFLTKEFCVRYGFEPIAGWERSEAGVRPMIHRG
jgi:GNAT superfamily N-acetyltransferase